MTSVFYDILVLDVAQRIKGNADTGIAGHPPPINGP